MPTSSQRFSSSTIGRVILNPIGLLFILGVIVVVVNIFVMCNRPEIPTPVTTVE